jgi:hypothetical protein
MDFIDAVNVAKHTIDLSTAEAGDIRIRNVGWQEA